MVSQPSPIPQLKRVTLTSLFSVDTLLSLLELFLPLKGRNGNFLNIIHIFINFGTKIILPRELIFSSFSVDSDTNLAATSEVGGTLSLYNVQSLYLRMD